MERELVLTNRSIVYHLDRKPIKNIYLRINLNRGIYVTAHPSVPIENIEKFILSKEKWIDSALLRLNQKKVEQESLIENQAIRFLGKTVPLKLIISNNNRLSISEDQATLHIKQIYLDRTELVFDQENARYLNQIIDQMKGKYDAIIAQYNITPPLIKIRKMKSKWGSCQVEKKLITLNTNLIHYPLESIEYVLWHEYAHLISPNHSKRFWQIVGSTMPHYKEYQQRLKSF